MRDPTSREYGREGWKKTPDTLLYMHIFRHHTHVHTQYTHKYTHKHRVRVRVWVVLELSETTSGYRKNTHKSTQQWKTGKKKTSHDESQCHFTEWWAIIHKGQHPRWLLPWAFSESYLHRRETTSSLVITTVWVGPGLAHPAAARKLIDMTELYISWEIVKLEFEVRLASQPLPC